jgi:hypothetical protein
MFFAEDLTWNVRDTHMTETVTHLHEYLETKRGIRRPKIAICACMLLTQCSCGLRWRLFFEKSRR